MKNSNILDQLKEEHNEVKTLLNQAVKCESYERGDILVQIKKKLVSHARGEEKTVYSLLKGCLDEKQASEKDINLTNEAYEEHRVVDELLKKLDTLYTSDEKWPAHLKVLKENVEHHIKEEEDDLFKLIKQHFTKANLKELKGIYIAARDTYSESQPSQSQIVERQPSAAAESVNECG